jgi:hypothetical protein
MACSALSSISRPPSTASSQSTTATEPSHSSGALIQMPSSQAGAEGSKRWRQSNRWRLGSRSSNVPTPPAAQDHAASMDGRADRSLAKALSPPREERGGIDRQRQRAERSGAKACPGLTLRSSRSLAGGSLSRQRRWRGEFGSHRIIDDCRGRARHGAGGGLTARHHPARALSGAALGQHRGRRERSPRSRERRRSVLRRRGRRPWEGL